MFSTIIYWLTILRHFIVAIIVLKILRFIYLTFIRIRRGYFYYWDYENERYLFLGRKKRWKIPKLCGGYVKVSIFEKSDGPDANKIIDLDDMAGSERGFVDNPDDKTKKDKMWVRVWLYEGDKELTEKLEKIGYIDLHGDVYATNEKGENPVFVGVVANNNKMVSRNGNRWWKTLFLWHHLDVFTPDMLCGYEPGNTKKLELTQEAQALSPFGIGCTSETGRWWKLFSSDAPTVKSFPLVARAAAALLLYKDRAEYLPDEDKGERHRWWDTALIAAVTWIALFTGFWFLQIENNYVIFPWMGKEISLVISLYLSYFLIWFIWHEIKLISLSSSAGNSFIHFLELFNRNTNIRKYDYAIIVIAIIGVILSIVYLGYPFIALLTVIITGIAVIEANYSGKPWPIIAGYSSSTSKDSKTKDKEAQNRKMHQQSPDRKLIVKNYQWSSLHLDSDNKFNLSIEFDENHILKKRETNPFKIDNDKARRQYHSSVELLLHDGDMYIDEVVLKLRQIAREKNFDQIDEISLMLSFVQANIQYKNDTESTLIGNKEYCRFPVETLFDMEGDCDCKSALAANIFNAAGYKTLYVFTSTFDHAYVAVALRDSQEIQCDIDYEDPEKFGIISVDGNNYYVCETTGVGRRLGEIASSQIYEDLKDKKYSYIIVKQKLGGA